MSVTTTFERMTFKIPQASRCDLDLWPCDLTNQISSSLSPTAPKLLIWQNSHIWLVRYRVQKLSVYDGHTAIRTAWIQGRLHITLMSQNKTLSSVGFQSVIIIDRLSMSTKHFCSLLHVSTNLTTVAYTLVLISLSPLRATTLQHVQNLPTFPVHY